MNAIKELRMQNFMDALHDYIDERISHHIARYEHGGDPSCERLLQTAETLEKRVAELMQ